MRLLRQLARPMMAAIYVYAGTEAVRHPAVMAAQGEPITRRVAPLLRLPEDPELHVRVTGATQVGAGVLLASGRLPRLAAAVLAATTVPTTLAQYRFWSAIDPVQKKAQREGFLKNLAMLGGLISVAAGPRR